MVALDARGGTGRVGELPFDHSSGLWQDPLTMRVGFPALGQDWTGPG
jgi:hypothetical protein